MIFSSVAILAQVSLLQSKRCSSPNLAAMKRMIVDTDPPYRPLSRSAKRFVTRLCEAWEARRERAEAQAMSKEDVDVGFARREGLWYRWQ